ncbi:MULTISPECIES: hypothetical protein [unclassified Kitasatospora]|uniref:hypothetical protein n=1 Tax=unclassified Kitasatospora TaxID=2633591 RepID=UPI00070B6725|nr:MULTISPECIES: hypothetical protein [unclassified Kitasatospora]KQV11907.1 hypothetical protein ASC99_35610 [Kitasatospora sp. Root107]KRB68895.1 hypothetical protein ASE03_28775 [Kitasatospora sp. Root187]
MRTRPASALATFALATGMLVSAPAATAQASDYPHWDFDVTLGNTYTRGTVTWFNRSVSVTGEHKSVDPASCRGTTAFTLDSAGHQLNHSLSDHQVCGTSAKFTFNVPANVPGGAASVRVCLDNGAQNSPITYLLCERHARPSS